MKYLLVVLLLCGIAYSAQIDWVTMTSSLKNEHDVVVVFLKGANGASYTLSCNGDAPTCRFPAKGKTYELRDADNKLYKCQNVELVYGITETLGPYCMAGVE